MRVDPRPAVIGGVTQTSDADGNQTGLTYPNTASFVYDDLNRMTQQVSGGVVINYLYDGLGRRVMSSSAADGTRYYVYDGDLLIGEVTVSGGEATPAVAYTWGANGLVSERFLTGTAYSLWYHFGPQGETRQLTDQTGAVADSYLYTAYGEPVASTGADRNPFQYGGQVGYYTGPGAGLVLCGARRYNPYTARWMTRDPIGYAGGADLYAYCGESPVGGLDASGALWDIPPWARNSMETLRWVTVIGSGLLDKVKDAGAYIAGGSARIVRAVHPQPAEPLSSTLIKGLRNLQLPAPRPSGPEPGGGWDFAGRPSLVPAGDIPYPRIYVGPPQDDIPSPARGIPGEIWTGRSPGSGGGLAAPGIILDGAGVLAAGLDAIIPYRMRIEALHRDIDGDPGPAQGGCHD